VPQPTGSLLFASVLSRKYEETRRAAVVYMGRFTGVKLQSQIFIKMSQE
jgi:hypothetical protein